MSKIIDRPKCRRGDCFANFDGMGYPDVSIQKHVNNYLSKIDIRKEFNYEEI